MKKYKWSYLVFAISMTNKMSHLKYKKVVCRYYHEIIYGKPKLEYYHFLKICVCILGWCINI